MPLLFKQAMCQISGEQVAACNALPYKNLRRGATKGSGCRMVTFLPLWKRCFPMSGHANEQAQTTAPRTFFDSFLALRRTWRQQKPGDAASTRARTSPKAQSGRVVFLPDARPLQAAGGRGALAAERKAKRSQLPTRSQPHPADASRGRTPRKVRTPLRKMRSWACCRTEGLRARRTKWGPRLTGASHFKAGEPVASKFPVASWRCGQRDGRLVKSV